eukprot:TRINITY_DN73399_c0_g1_i1.p1 TRINITY_DN73399_c0_g1~~TRINITY_DN73399_c0_g1_i1.p1  ORF type:complete len:192 (-),score=35.04 TRINITY_DN73399_c0_g1_i1:466-969(-)
MLSPCRDAEVLSGRPTVPGGSLDKILTSEGREQGTSIVKVDVDGQDEEVQLDAERGPLMLQQDGSFTFCLLNDSPVHGSRGMQRRQEKTWTYLTSTEKNIMIHMVAKRNRRLKEHIRCPPLASQIKYDCTQRRMVPLEEPSGGQQVLPYYAGCSKGLLAAIGRIDEG